MSKIFELYIWSKPVCEVHRKTQIVTLSCLAVNMFQNRFKKRKGLRTNLKQASIEQIEDQQEESWATAGAPGEEDAAGAADVEDLLNGNCFKEKA